MTWREKRRIAVRAVCGSAGALFITRCTTDVGSGRRERAFTGLLVGVVSALAGGLAGPCERAGEGGHSVAAGAPGLWMEATSDLASALGPSVRAMLEKESDLCIKLLMTSQDVELKSEPAVALLLCASAARGSSGARACDCGGGLGSVGLGVRAESDRFVASEPKEQSAGMCVSSAGDRRRGVQGAATTDEREELPAVLRCEDVEDDGKGVIDSASDGVCGRDRNEQVGRAGRGSGSRLKRETRGGV